MANMASVAYAIEGPQKDLEEVLGAIIVSNPLSDGSGFRLPQIEVYDDYRE